jgi:dipeptidyl-peptidase-4
MIKPADFNPAKEYPVLMYVYGGPGSQLVRDAWQGGRDYWFHYLAQQGYIVACVDNLGTGGRGRNFKHITYGQMGKYEVQDQIAAARYLSRLPFVNPERIGIWGWSYGGYMSSLALFIGNDVFKSAIAVAPVTNWRFYDTIYTERFLSTPQLNPEGYDAYSPLLHVDKLKGNLLLIHGTGDDNVHFQNSVMLQDALIASGKQFDSFFYPNRNHGIYGGNTRMHLFRLMSNFIENKL